VVLDARRSQYHPLLAGRAALTAKPKSGVVDPDPLPSRPVNRRQAGGPSQLFDFPR
jgi:hypothetical protein